MKRVHKKLFGATGLMLVAVTTFVAANIPDPNASAATSSVSDTIIVRVLSESPIVTIASPKDDAVYLDGNQTISYDYEKVQHIRVILSYTNENGVTKEHILDDTDVDPSQPGSGSIPLNLLDDDRFGYGEYTLTVIGRGNDGVSNDKTISFSLYPVIADARQDEKTNDVVVDLKYNAASDDVEKFIIEVYDETGNLINDISPATIYPPSTQVILPFNEKGIPSGKYLVRVTTYGKDGNVIYKYIEIEVNYKSARKIVVPDTGGAFGGLNITNSDYLITGLIVFGIVGIGGAFFVLRHRK